TPPGTWISSVIPPYASTTNPPSHARRRQPCSAPALASRTVSIWRSRACRSSSADSAPPARSRLTGSSGRSPRSCREPLTPRLGLAPLAGRRLGGSALCHACLGSFVGPDVAGSGATHAALVRALAEGRPRHRAQRGTPGKQGVRERGTTVVLERPEH